MTTAVHTTALLQGQLAAQNGYERISPYGGLKASEYWYKGYDSVKR